MAPKISWPWPPMLNRPTRSGITTARPVSTSGAVFCRVRVRPPGTNSACLISVSYANSGATPCSRIRSAPTASAMTSATTMTTPLWWVSRNASGCRSGRLSVRRPVWQAVGRRPARPPWVSRTCDSNVGRCPQCCVSRPRAKGPRRLGADALGAGTRWVPAPSVRSGGGHVSATRWSLSSEGDAGLQRAGLHLLDDLVDLGLDVGRDDRVEVVVRREARPCRGSAAR